MPSYDNTYRNLLLQGMIDDTTRLVLCSQEPTTFAEANQLVGASPAGFRLGSKASPTLSIGAGPVSGRSLYCAVFTDGEIEANGGSTSGMFYALIDVTDSRLIMTQAVTGDRVVVNGDTWGITGSGTVPLFNLPAV